VLLAVLAVSAALPGLWGTLAPRGFYDGFPGAAHWVDRLPPYSAHLIADVGAFYLAFAVLFAWAALRPARPLVLAACTAWSVFGALHLLFHVTHLGGFPTADAVAQTVSLAAVLALPAGVALLLRERPAQDSRAPCGPNVCSVRRRT
jgi:hypothetical protein